MASKESFVWCIAYINSNQIQKVQDELQKYKEFEGIKVYIPTVKMLKKKFKNKKQFVDVPLFFNYGFFKLPRIKAINPIFLSRLRERISCIRGWVRDASKIWNNPASDPVEDKEERISNSPIATINDIELSKIIEAESKLSVHSKKDIETLKEGQIVTLQGYPFDGLEAKIERVNKSKGEVEVSLSVEGAFKHAKVDFENIFYTIYQNSEEENEGHLSLEELKENNPNKIDEITAEKGE